MESQSPGPGLLGTIRQMVDTFLGVLHNRIELASTELQEEKLRAMGLVVMVAGGVLFGVLAVLMLTLAVIYTFIEHAVGLFWMFTGIYSLGAVILFASIRNRLKSGPLPFAGTIEELKKDREWVRPKN